MSFEQQVRAGTTSVSSPNWFELVIPMISNLRYRRLYIGGFWRGDVDDCVFSAKCEFNQAKIAGGTASINFAWRSKSTGTVFTSTPINSLNAFPVVPPFTVEIIDDIQLPQFPSATAPRPDELITSHVDGLESRTRLVRMAPIPIFTESSYVRVVFRADYSTATGLLPIFTGVCGVRSSEVPL